MRSYAAATWATMEAVHHLMLEVIVVEVNVLLAIKLRGRKLKQYAGQQNTFFPTTG